MDHRLRRLERAATTGDPATFYRLYTERIRCGLCGYCGKVTSPRVILVDLVYPDSGEVTEQTFVPNPDCCVGHSVAIGSTVIATGFDGIASVSEIQAVSDSPSIDGEATAQLS